MGKKSALREEEERSTNQGRERKKRVGLREGEVGKERDTDRIYTIQNERKNEKQTERQIEREVDIIMHSG